MAYCLLLVYIEKVETSPLTTLNLSRNFIRDEGAKAIGEALAVNAALTTLE